MKEELKNPSNSIDYYVEKFKDIEQKISDLCKEKKAIMDELIAHNCPFKVGDYVSVTDKDINRGIPRYGVIKYIKYSLEYKRFLYIINKINKKTKECNREQIYYTESSIIEKFNG